MMKNGLLATAAAVANSSVDSITLTDVIGLADGTERGAQTDAKLTFTADHPVGADQCRWVP